MSQASNPEGGPVVKTLAIRLDLSLHAQLSFIAQLQGHTITDEIRLAIESHLDRMRSDAEITAKADAVLEEIERDTTARREAIAALFGDAATPPQPDEPAKPPTRRSRNNSSEGEGLAPSS